MQKTSIFTLTALCSVAVLAHRFVDFDGSPCDAVGAKPLGAAVNAAAVGDAFPVDVIGTTKVEAGAAIPLGSKGLTPVMTDAVGRAIAWDGAGKVAGYALQPALFAGAVIEVLLSV
jgi:Uncharacterized conserved protein (DUF2190)